MAPHPLREFVREGTHQIAQTISTDAQCFAPSGSHGDSQAAVSARIVGACPQCPEAKCRGAVLTAGK